MTDGGWDDSEVRCACAHSSRHRRNEELRTSRISEFARRRPATALRPTCDAFKFSSSRISVICAPRCPARIAAANETRRRNASPRRNPCCARACGDLLDRRGVRQPQLEMAQPDRAGRRRRRADARPGVQPEVMVVAAGGDEDRARAEALRQLEAEHADIELLRFLELATRRCTWPIVVPLASAPLSPSRSGSARTPSKSSGSAPIRSWPRVVGPLLARAIAVDLDAVAVGIGEIQRFADAVIGRALQHRPRSRPGGGASAPDRRATGRGWRSDTARSCRGRAARFPTATGSSRSGPPAPSQAVRSSRR